MRFIGSVGCEFVPSSYSDSELLSQLGEGEDAKCSTPALCRYFLFRSTISEAISDSVAIVSEGLTTEVDDGEADGERDGGLWQSS